MELSGFKVKVMLKTPSTQTVLKGMLKEAAQTLWPLVWTLEQTAGKGLGSNRWESEAGKNLTFSFAWFPEFLAASDQFEISKTVSLAICDVVADHLPEQKVSVKWPNDVYVEDDKIAGVLIEHNIRGNAIAHSVIGIGFNVNQSEFRSDAPNPISLMLLTGKKYDLEACLKQLCGALQRRYQQLIIDHSAIDRDYLDLLYRRNVCSRYVYGKRELDATITGVNEFGQLELIDKEGKQLTCSFKEIIFK